MLRALSRRLGLAVVLRRLGKLLRLLSVRRRKTRGPVRLLGCAGKPLEIVVTKHIPITEPGRAGVRIVEVLEGNHINIIFKPQIRTR